MHDPCRLITLHRLVRRFLVAGNRFALHMWLPPNARIKRRNNRCDSIGTSVSPILCALDVPLNEKVWHDLKFIRWFENIPKRVEKWQTTLTKPVLRRVYLCVNVNTLKDWSDVIYWCVCTDMWTTKNVRPTRFLSPSDNFEHFNLNSDVVDFKVSEFPWLKLFADTKHSAESSRGRQTSGGWCSNKLAPCMAKTSPSDKQTVEQCFHAIIRRQKLHIFSH